MAIWKLMKDEVDELVSKARGLPRELKPID